MDCSLNKACYTKKNKALTSIKALIIMLYQEIICFEDSLFECFLLIPYYYSCFYFNLSNSHALAITDLRAHATIFIQTLIQLSITLLFLYWILIII